MLNTKTGHSLLLAVAVVLAGCQRDVGNTVAAEESSDKQEKPAASPPPAKTTAAKSGTAKSGTAQSGTAQSGTAQSHTTRRIDPDLAVPGDKKTVQPGASQKESVASPDKKSPAQHPFAPAIRRASDMIGRLEKIPDYTAVMCKRERIAGRLGKHQYMSVKIRHKPLSVYLKFLAPESLAGREVIYVQGQNDGKLIAHEREGGLAGLLGKITGGTYRFLPTRPIAMLGNRYPITEIGLLNLSRRLVEVGELDMKHGEAEVRYFNNAKINGRRAPAMEFVHPTERKHFRFHAVRIFIDKQLGVPVRYAAYLWPEKPGGKPVLLEEYTYLNVKLNAGLTDKDFNPTHADYSFPEE